MILLSKKFVLKIDNIPYFYFLQQQPLSNINSFFCLLLPYPLVSLGSSFFCSFSEKISLEEKLIAFSSQFNQLKDK
jgi:hypothetical protein